MIRPNHGTAQSMLWKNRIAFYADRDRIESCFFTKNFMADTQDAAIETTSTDTFEQDIAEGVAIVDFWAEWCGPCQMMLPRLQQVAGQLDGRARVMKLNVDDDPEIAQNFRIMSIPTILVFKDGKPVEQFVGVQEVDALVAAVEKHLAA